MGAINAKVRYVNDEWQLRAEPPFIYSKALRHANTTEHDVTIADARTLHLDGALDLDVNGFVLTEFPAEAMNFRNESAVRSRYQTEIAPLVQSLTGADAVFVCSHQIRTETPKSFVNAYARYVHCDYLMTIEGKNEQRILDKNGCKTPIGTVEFAWYNIWAPIDRIVEQNALTVIDASTVLDEQLVDYHYSKSTRQSGSVPIYDPAHRFYYFSNMSPNEAIVFKQLDSRRGIAKACPHTAFYDTSVKHFYGRRSIELRALCLFER